MTAKHADPSAGRALVRVAAIVSALCLAPLGAMAQTATPPEGDPLLTGISIRAMSTLSSSRPSRTASS